MDLLGISALTKAFGGLLAVNNVSFTVEPRQIKALIGPNGAGKTTTFNMISGLIRPTSGHVQFQGRPIEDLSPEAIHALGIARTFQRVRLFKGMTVLEHALVGAHQRTRAEIPAIVLGLPFVRREREQIVREAHDILNLVGLADRRDDLATSLSFGQQRLVEIARALMSRPTLLMLDEPAAGLTPGETSQLGTLLRRLSDDGLAVLVVEHDMDFVMTISDSIVVLNFGEKIAEGSPSEVRRNPAVISAYLGASTISQSITQ